MEYISINKKNFKNYKLDKKKCDTNQEEKENEIELIKERNNIYKIEKELFNKEKIQFSNGSIKDKNYTINNDNNLSNYNKNNTSTKHIYIAASLNPYCFDNNNNYNNDDSNNGGNIHKSHLINNKNNFITGSRGKNIKQIKYDNNSLSKKDSKKFSNMAKTLKYFSNKGASYINSNYENISGKRSSDVNNNFLINDFSNDKNNNPDNKSNINNNKINIRNLDIQTNNNKNTINQIERAVPGIDIKKNKILLNVNKDLLSTKLDLKYKFLNEENKSKTPLKVNSRYYNNNNQKYSSNEGDNKVNGGDNNLNDFLEKDEWDPNNKSKEINKNVEEDKDVISYNIISNNNKEFNNQNNSNKNNNIKNYNNNENNVESNEQENNQYFYNLSNLNRNIKLNIEKNNVPNYTITNFSNKKNKYDQNYVDILKEYQKSNLNDKTMKTPKSIKDNSPLDIIFSKSGKNYKIRNNRSFKNSFANEPSFKDVNILNNDSNRQTSSNKNNIISKVNINSENNNSKEKEKNTYNINIQQNIKNINQPIIINNKINNNNKNQIQEIPNQKKIKINNNNNNNTENNNTENNNNDIINNRTNNFNNITNNIKLNGNDKNNIIIIKQNSNNKIIFHKKLNRSPPAFKKKPNFYNDLNNFDLTENNKSLTKINKQNYQENNSPTNLQNILNINKLKTESNIYNYNNNFKSNILNVKENNIEINKIKTEKNMNSIDSYKNPYIINRPNGTIYKKQKAIKKIPMQKAITKGKLDVKVINEIKKEEKKNDVNNNDIIYNRHEEKINNKICLKHHKITKLYDYSINYPKINKCCFSKIYFKNLKIPKIEVCNISKINSVIYILYKNKSICYITKTREKIKKIIKPPINDICECSKSIILNPSNQNIKKIEEEKKNIPENKPQIVASKKNKKRKKRRKTRRLHKGNDNNNKENNNNEDNNNNENNGDEKSKGKEETNEETSNKEEKEEENNMDNNNINNNIEKNENNNISQNIENNINKNINIEKEIEKISVINSNSQINILEENKNNIINDKSYIYKSSNEEKSAFSEREINIHDIAKNSSIKKKLSPTTYNDDDYNDEENEDYRIASEDELSEDKFKKKESLKNNNKTEGKEIKGDFDKNNKIDKKLTAIEKKVKGLELLEKIQGKRSSFTINELDNNIFFNNDLNNTNNYKNMNKNILLGTNKLNEIFNNPKNIKYDNEIDEYNQIDNEEENEDIYINSNFNFSDEEIKNSRIQKEIIDNENKINNNNNIYIRKNNTYKNSVDYEKIGTIFDKLEGIFGKKKSNGNIENINFENIENEKCKTPSIKNNSKISNRVTDLNIYNNNEIASNNFIENENESNNYIENESNNENNEDISDEKKSTNMTKYKDILNDKQQIISKLELLMNKQKNKTNQDNNINNYIFNSPKIESEIDSDMNINKDTPGNRKEIKKNNLLMRQNSINDKKIYTYEEILLYKNKKICLNTNLLSLDAINHCNEIIITLQEDYSSFKKNYKNIFINTNNNYSLKNNIVKSDKELTMAKWARKDMSKEIEEAEKYVKELNTKMSKDNYKYKIIEILNTLTVDNYKNILSKIIEMVYLSDNNNKVELNKPEYLLHNQCILVEIILDKATIEKGYVVLYAKLCADLYIEYIKLIKEYNNSEIESQLINGENLKTILTSECRQRFDECVSVSTLSKNLDDEEKKEIFLIFKKKFLGNMNFIAELINVKILSQTKGFEFLDILYKRYKQIKNNDKIKYLNLEGAVTLLTKFGKIIMDRQNSKHIQNLDNYMKDKIYPIISSNNDENKGLPNYLKFKIINLIEKKKDNWKDSLYEQSITAKGKNNNINNISLYHDGTDSIININIDESWTDTQKLINNTNQEKEDSIIILLKNDIENYVSFLNDHNILNKNDLNEYNIKNENNDINNEYDWSISEELIIKTKNELEEIIRCYIEVCIDYVTKEKTIFYCNEYIKNIINYYSVDLNKDEAEKVHISMNDLYLNIEDICIDNYYMLEIMGYLLFILINNNLFYISDFDKFINEDKNKIIKISQVIKFTLAHSDEKYNELYNNFKKIKLFDNNNKNIFEEYIKKPLKNDFGINSD